ncbi:MAG TPA: hypothetical protein VLA43_09585 [Longimicrobiales bacterium]|nr:hypothetical protein [Longimicrobiales bacterium]
MKRTLILPISAAFLGIFMALGVFALKRAAVNAWEDQSFEFTIDGPEGIVVDVNGEFIRGEILRDVLSQVREEIRVAVESDRELTEAERAELQAAMEQLEAKLGRLVPAPADAPPAPPASETQASAGPAEPAGN